MHQSAVIAAALLVVESAAVISVAVRLARRVVPASGATLDRATVGVLIALVQVVGLAQLLGAVGLLYRWPVLIGYVALAAAVRRFVRPAGHISHPRSGASTSTALVAGIGSGILSLAAVMSLSGPSQEADTVQYHLPNAAWWLRTGSTWALPPTTPGYFTNAYPSNGELAGLWLILPTHNDTLAYLAPLAFAVLCVCGTALLAKELNAPAWCGALVAIAVLASPLSLSTQAHSLQVDLLAAGGVVTGAAFALRAVREPATGRWTVLAGLAVGLGIGAKDTALLPGLAVLVLMAVLTPRVLRTRRTVAAVGAAAALSAFWFVRDWVDVGDPVFPQGLVLGGHRILQGAQGPLTYYRTTMLQHLDHGDAVIVGRWAHLAVQEYGPVLLVLAVGMGASAWSAWRWRRRPMLGLLIAITLSLVAYLTTPYTGGGPDGLSSLLASQLRYSLPAALLAAAVTAATSRRVVPLLAVPALGYDAYRALQGPGFRHDLTPGALAIAVSAAVSVVVAAGWFAFSADADRIRDRIVEPFRRRPRVAFALAAMSACLVSVGAGVAVTALAGREGTDRLGAVLDHEGRPRGPVVVLGTTNVRSALGGDLQRNVVTLGGGGAVHEVPLRSPAELDARIRQITPAAMLLGSQSLGVPPGWAPPAGWVAAGTNGPSTIYVPRTATPPRVPPSGGKGTERPMERRAGVG